jgi:hypothetical protein
MNALIFAILTCTSGSNGVCLNSYPIQFRSAQECVSFMKHNMAHGRELTDGRAYANNRHSVWFECDQKVESEWQSVREPAQVAQPAPAKPKEFTIAECMKAWEPNCMMQEHPAFYSVASDCIAVLKGMLSISDKLYIDVDEDGQVQVKGNSPDAWLQCYGVNK